MELLRQRTLVFMHIQLWETYEQMWVKFSTSNHVSVEAPIPPDCKVLTFHIFVRRGNSHTMKDFRSFKLDQFKDCYKEAKRRL